MNCIQRTTKLLLSQRSYATTRLGRMEMGSGGGSSNNQTPPPKESAWSRMSLGQKVVQSGKNTGYLGVILAGVGLGGLSLSYVVFDFIEDYQSQKLFDDAFDKVSHHAKVIDMVGTPMKGHGGLGPRGAPTNAKRTIYKDDQGGDKQVIMYFVLEGPNGKGTVYVNQIKNNEGEYEYNVLSADVQRHGMRSPKRVFIIDNRMRRGNSGPRKGWFARSIWKKKETAETS
ncbi:TIM21-domain-containing protein [Obelidium mucronatum]|nr:TIM21-domain-containing protein [Obelidium mucronatum]